MGETKKKPDKKTIILIAAIVVAVLAAVAVIIVVSMNSAPQEDNSPEAKAVAAYKELLDSLSAQKELPFKDVYFVTDEFIVFIKGDVAEKTYTVDEKNYFDLNRGLVLSKKAFSDTNAQGNLIIQVDNKGNVFYRTCSWNAVVDDVNKAEWLQFVVTNGAINYNITVTV